MSVERYIDPRDKRNVAVIAEHTGRILLLKEGMLSTEAYGSHASTAGIAAQLTISTLREMKLLPPEGIDEVAFMRLADQITQIQLGQSL